MVRQTLSLVCSLGFFGFLERCVIGSGGVLFFLGALPQVMLAEKRLNFLWNVGRHHASQLGSKTKFAAHFYFSSLFLLQQQRDK